MFWVKNNEFESLCCHFIWFSIDLFGIFGSILFDVDFGSVLFDARDRMNIMHLGVIFGNTGFTIRDAGINIFTKVILITTGNPNFV